MNLSAYLRDTLQKVNQVHTQLDLLARPFGLTPPQAAVLVALQERGLTMGDLADELGCSRGNLTGIIDRMERDGLIARERSADDRRQVLAVLTNRGRDVLGRMQRETVPSDLLEAVAS